MVGLSDGLVTSTKEIRYDRQLRLWGDNGQTALENAKICLLNASVIGAEVLKSLVLPGIGSFTIIDHRLVTENDVRSNFFTDHSQIGGSIAEAVCKHIVELNPEVKGKHVDKCVGDLVENDGDKSFLDQFDLVIGTELCEKYYLDIGQYLSGKGNPFVICKCYGLTGYLRIIAPEHFVFDAHPDFRTNSFQLDRPFPALKHLCDSINLDSLSHEKHSHVPYLLLILKALEKWQAMEQTNGKKVPSNYAEKRKLKEVLLSMRMPDEKGNLEEENIHEALNAVQNSIVSSEIPSSLRNLLKDPRVDKKRDTNHFWLSCKALGAFIFEENGGMLPIRGDLPDMISDSDSYVHLQNLYYEQAEKQARRVHDFVCEIATDEFSTSSGIQNHKIERENGRSKNVCLPTFEQTRSFCKNAAFIRVIDSRPLSAEYNVESNGISGQVLRQTCQRVLQDQNLVEKRSLDLYLIWRACERFNAEKNRYPGTNGVPENLDKLDLKTRIKNLSHTYELPVDYVVDDSLVEEMCRYGASEVHSVASFMGGLAAQETIKLITGQFVPLNNTFIFDGNLNAGAVFEF